MASLYTDEARTARYAKLRTVKKQCERALDICMWAMVLVGIFEIIPDLFDGLLRGVFIGELEPFFIAITAIAGVCFSVFAIYRKDRRITAAALVLAILLTAAGLYSIAALSPIILAVTLAADFVWKKLEQEEGFPLFDISYAEQEERRKVQERRTKHRALEAGVRAAAEQTSHPADMNDLLDAGCDAPVIPAELKNYHNYCRDANPAETVRQTQSEIMDILEEM